MKKTDRNKAYGGFEQGPIRPPSESGSLLIRVTRNCPWNRCSFCSLYKERAFSLRPVEHILKDIDCVARCVAQIMDGQGSVRVGADSAEEVAFYAALNWVGNGMQSIFLQDSNSLIIKADDLVTVLQYLREAFPKVERVTSYARSHTIAKISDNDLSRMATSGLNRIHIGMESASDTVLQQVNKGTDKATQIRAGEKVKRAGMELSEYYMPGLGGKLYSREHALESADALNQINPDFIRLRTLSPPQDGGLFRDPHAGTFEPMGDTLVAKEILLFLESLQGIGSTVKSDHVLNLFQEVEGTLPEDREAMLSPLKTYLSMDRGEQVLYQVGRRCGVFSQLGDLQKPELRAYAERHHRQLGVNAENIDSIIASLMTRFI